MTEFKSKPNYLLQEVTTMNHQEQQRFLNLLVKSLGCNTAKAQISTITIKKMAELALSIDDKQDKYIQEELEKFIRINNNPPSDTIVKQLEILLGNCECEQVLPLFKGLMADEEHQKLSVWVSDELSDYPHLAPLFGRHLKLLLEVLQVCDGIIKLSHTDVIDHLIVVNEMMDWEQDCACQYIHQMIDVIRQAVHETGQPPVNKDKMMAFLMAHFSDLSDEQGMGVINVYFSNEIADGKFAVNWTERTL